MQKMKNNLNFNDFKKDVEKKAYELYSERMKKNEKGDDFSDWIKAEKELKVKNRNF